uniref:Uncharacterized protein n=1 Tax=Branchiostoma floridae TaxID=7739 RepID=C3Y1K9_BRAFL|eukprot:XP_002609739.1 hypothetical protein BRAFLDRAFT_78550 [Branchiostoma floridae]
METMEGNRSCTRHRSLTDLGTRLGRGSESLFAARPVLRNYLDKIKFTKINVPTARSNKHDLTWALTSRSARWPDDILEIYMNMDLHRLSDTCSIISVRLKVKTRVSDGRDGPVSLAGPTCLMGRQRAVSTTGTSCSRGRQSRGDTPHESGARLGFVRAKLGVLREAQQAYERRQKLDQNNRVGTQPPREVEDWSISERGNQEKCPQTGSDSSTLHSPTPGVPMSCTVIGFQVSDTNRLK